MAMRVRRRAALAVASCTAVSGVVTACAREAVGPSSHVEPAPIAVVVAPPEPEPPAGEVDPKRAPNPLVERAPSSETEKPAPWLPPAWSREQISPTMSYADAMRDATHSRRALAALATPRARGDGGVAFDEATKAWFNRASTLLERADRSYAAAFAALDATESERIDAIAEASGLVSLFAQRLEDMGLAVLPRAWQSDALVHATFEDVDVGPVRRLRSAARALAARCVVEATASSLATPASASCKRLAGEIPHHETKRDAGSSACACDPGDPLCTGSAWCGP
jgi:hypothetical protein